MRLQLFLGHLFLPNLGEKHSQHVLYLSNDHLLIMIEEQYSPRKQSARTSQTSVAAAAIGQFSLISYSVWMCVSRALHERIAILH